MNRRTFLTLFAGSGTSGCLNLQDPGEGASTGTETPDQPTTAASVTEVNRRTLDISALSATGNAYAVVSSSNVYIYEYGASDATLTFESGAVNTVVELTDTACYVGAPADGTTTVSRVDRQTGSEQVQASIDGDIDRATVVGSYLVCGSVESGDNYTERYGLRITVLDAETLEQRWTTAFGGNSYPGEVCLIDDTLHVGFTNFLAGFTMSTGTLEYRSSLGVAYPRAYQGDLITDADSQLQRIDPSTMTAKWKTGSSVLGRPVIYGDSVAAPTTDGLLAVDIADGSQQWMRTLESSGSYVTDQLQYYGGILWFGSPTAELFGIIPATGETAFTAEYDIDHLASVSNGIVANDGRDGVVELDINAN